MPAPPSLRFSSTAARSSVINDSAMFSAGRDTVTSCERSGSYISSNRRLRKNIGRALAARMVGVTFDLDRPALHKILQAIRSPRRRATSRSRRNWACPGSIPSGGLNVRNDLLGGLDDAAAQAGKGQRSSHDLDEISAAERVVPFLDLVRIFSRRRTRQIPARRQIPRRFANIPCRSCAKILSRRAEQFCCLLGSY